LLYDLSELVWSRRFKYEDDFIARCAGIYSSTYNLKSRTIVLTEGKTDAWILEQSLNVIYPHLQGLLSFLDFESSGYGGGVGNLANTVKALAGSGIMNNIIALFDNDTAASAACKTLKTLSLPSNMIVKKLPSIKLLRKYPTIGPSGKGYQDVNGIAGSIELYLGEDVLRMQNGHLTPIQWTGYDRGEKQYQGEVLDKLEIHERFKNKLEDYKRPLGKEWDGLRSILDLLIGAFTARHENAIYQTHKVYFAR